jgi:hypothetical protein
MGHEKKMKLDEKGVDERSQAERDTKAAKHERDEQAGQVRAQDRPEGARTESEATGEKARMRGPGQIVLSSTLLNAGGVDVKTKDGIDAGDLTDLMVDLHGGHIAYAIVDREDAIVPENQLCAVPWEEFRLQRAEPRPDLIVELTVSKIKDAPGFQDSQWPDMGKMEWSERIHAYYGATPYYEIYGYVSVPEDEYGERNFAQGEARTCKGSIQSVDRSGQALGASKDHRPITLRMKVTESQFSQQHPSGTIVTVILAPASFLQAGGLNLQEGQEISVNGWLTDRPGEARLVAMSVESGGKSVQLRDRNGRPQWMTSGAESHQPTAKEQQPGTPR